MSRGEVHARHYGTGQNVRLRWKDGVITSIEPTEAPAPENIWVAPGLFDLQINGYAGIDFQQDNLRAEDLLRACERLQRGGCTRFLPTLITDEWPKLMDRLVRLRKLRAQLPELQSSIAGWHIEGPFLSNQPGFAGAHDPTLMCDPTPEQIHELRVAAGNDPVLLTLAPERLDAIAAVSLATSLGIKVSLGHTNAQHKRLLQAIKAGAVGFTHLGNGCPRELDRADNILWRVFETTGLKISLIPDGLHVSPPLFRLMHRVIDGGSIYYTTDAMAAGGAPPGKYNLGKLQIEVGQDDVVRKPGSNLYAGSALRPIRAAFRAAEMLACSWQETWPRLSGIPAQLMGLEHELKPGTEATFCVLQVTPESWLESLQVYVRGNPISMDPDDEL
jgi:N-acetylglucosamine-6-phosphate deacetylase